MWFRSFLLTALVLSACDCEASSPEDQVRAVLAAAEDAAERNQFRALRALISVNYSDERGRDQQAMGQLLFLYVRRHRSVHVLTRVSSITFPEPTRAHVSLLVATAGQPIEAPEDLSRVSADLHRFELVLVDDDLGDWKVTSANWRRAQLPDFM